MAFELSSSLEEDGILRLRIGGERDPQGLPALIGQIIELARQPAARTILCNVCELKGRSSYSETYFSVRSIPADSPRLKTAVIDLPENMEKGSFYDTAAGNLGFRVRHFTEESAALAWLAEA